MAEDQNRTLTDKFMLRLPDGMRDRIKAAAEANSRSMNAEIVATLDEKYSPAEAAWRGLITAAKSLVVSIPRKADGKPDAFKRIEEGLNNPDIDIAGSVAYAVLKGFAEADSSTISDEWLLGQMLEALDDRKKRRSKDRASKTDP